MRIGIDARLWNESGVGRYTRNLILQLQKIDEKHEYILFVLHKDIHDVQSQITNTKWKVREANIQWHTLAEQIKFPLLLRKEKLDLVHFPYFSLPIFYGKPFVVTIHDLILHHFPTGQASTLPLPFYWMKLLGYTFIMQQSAKKARKIITVSYATKDEIVDHLHIDQKKISVTHEGVDENITKYTSRIPNKFHDTKYFLYIGNAYPHKNLDRLIEAFGEVRNEQSAVKLVLVGKEDFFYKRQKKHVQKLGLQNSVLFYGKATDAELAGLYKNALALIMPSLMEGFGLPVLEAMAHKCLVLASDIPALREICGNAAFYFDQNSKEAIKETLLTVCNSIPGAFNKKITEGTERIKKFSWEKMAKETLLVYESSIGL